MASHHAHKGSRKRGALDNEPKSKQKQSKDLKRKHPLKSDHPHAVHAGSRDPAVDYKGIFLISNHLNFSSCMCT